MTSPTAAIAAEQRKRERDIERYGSYRLAVAEHQASLTAIWQEMRFSGLEPAGTPPADAGPGMASVPTAAASPGAKSSSGKLSASDRLAGRVLAPLAEVHERRMPAVLAALQAERETGEWAARHAAVVEGLRNVARELARAEGFQEAVRLVEELQDSQRAVLAETLEAERRRVRELLDRSNK
jgi:hypothetical protein